MKPTKDDAIMMIKIYDWAIAQISDISTHGPPTQHVYYWQHYAGKTREEALRTDLERLEYWKGVLEKGD